MYLITKAQMILRYVSVFKLTLLGCLIASVAACSGGDTAQSNEASSKSQVITDVYVTVSLPVSSNVEARCELFSQGNIKLSDAHMTVGAQARFSGLQLKQGQFVYTQCVVPKHEEPFTQAVLPESILRGVLQVSASNNHISVNPLTELVWIKAHANLLNAPALADNLALAIGLSPEVSLLQDTPKGFKVPNELAASQSHSEYAAVLLGFDQLLKQQTAGKNLAELTTLASQSILQGGLRNDMAQKYVQALNTLASSTHLQAIVSQKQFKQLAENIQLRSPKAATHSIKHPKHSLSKSGGGAFDPGIDLTDITPLTAYHNTLTNFTFTGTFTSAVGDITLDGDLCSVIGTPTVTQISASCLTTSDISVTKQELFIDGFGLSQAYTATIELDPAPVIVQATNLTQLVYGSFGQKSMVITGTGFYSGLTVSLDGVTCSSSGGVNTAGTEISGINCTNVPVPLSGSSVSLAVNDPNLSGTGNTLSVAIALVQAPAAIFDAWTMGATISCPVGGTCTNLTYTTNCGNSTALFYTLDPASQAYASIQTNTGAVTVLSNSSAPLTVYANQMFVQGQCLAGTTSYQLNTVTMPQGTVNFQSNNPNPLSWTPNGLPLSFVNPSTATCSMGGNYNPSKTYSSSDPVNAPINANTGAMTIYKANPAGYVITVNIAAMGNCAATSKSYNLVVNKYQPVLMFANNALKTITYGDTGSALLSPTLYGVPQSATGNITYVCSSYINTMGTNTGCSLNNSGVIQNPIPGAGYVQVLYSGDDNYKPATANYFLTVNKAPVTISFTKTSVIKDISQGSVTNPITITGTQGAVAPVITYTSSQPLIANFANSTQAAVSFLSYGDTVMTAQITYANPYYTSNSASYSLKVTKDYGMYDAWEPNDVAVFYSFGQSNSASRSTILGPDRVLTPMSNVFIAKATTNMNFTNTTVNWSNYVDSTAGWVIGQTIGRDETTATNRANSAAYMARKWQTAKNAGMNLPNLYIINVAIGGQSLACGTGAGNNAWCSTVSTTPTLGVNPTSVSSLHFLAKHLIEASLSGLQAAGKRPRILGVDWNQWEADAASLTYVNQYVTNFNALDNGLSTSAGVPLPYWLHMPRAIGSMTLTYIPQMRTIIQQIASTSPRFKIIDTDASPYATTVPATVFNADGLHYTYQTQKWMVDQIWADIVAPKNPIRGVFRQQ